MNKMIFVNLPVTDLKRSIAFYEAVGATPNPQFSDEHCMMMVISDTIMVMLMDHEKFASFTPKAVPDAHSHAQMLLCLSEDSRDAVDATAGRAEAAGGVMNPTPAQDYGFMYGRSFEDPDGHIWELCWMDVEAAMAAGAEGAETVPA